MKLKGSKGYKFIFSICMGMMLLLNESMVTVYATENTDGANYEVVQQQEEVKELSALSDDIVSTVDETEEVFKIDENEIKANNMEHSFNVDSELTVYPSMVYNTRSSEENTDPNYAYIVSNDMVMQQAVENVGEFRWYNFSLETTSKVSILLQMVTELDADLYMFKLDEETYTLELTGGSTTEGLGTEEFYNTVMEPGTYFFAVAGYEGTGNFAFAYYESSLDVNNEINDYIDVATDVTLSTDITGVIDNPNDMDYYKFTVSDPTILRYSISTSNGYKLAYAGSTSSAPKVIDGTLIKMEAGTYYFAVYSTDGTYSSSDTYSIKFNKVGEYADESLVPLRGIYEKSGIVFQTNISGTMCYVNGNPIDISYEYHLTINNDAGYQSYNITLENKEGVHCQIWNEEVQGPDIVYYLYSSRPNIKTESKELLRLMYYTNDESVKFYRIMCRATGAYAENNLFVDPSYVIVLIDPDTGKLVDIAEYNYFYDYAVGSNSITTAGRYDMDFNYSLYDYIN